MATFEFGCVRHFSGFTLPRFQGAPLAIKVAIALGIAAASLPVAVQPSHGCLGVPTSINLDGLSAQPSPPMGENGEQWGAWKRWEQLETEPFMLGVSNMDYGGLMDMEYAAFGSVGDENDDRKGETFWYRVGRDRETTKFGTYGQAEVVYFVDGEIKGAMSVNILFDQPVGQSQR